MKKNLGGVLDYDFERQFLYKKALWILKDFERF